MNAAKAWSSVLIAGWMVAGCSGPPAERPDGWTIASDRGKPGHVRVRGLVEGWESESEVAAAIAKASDIFWAPGTPADVRIAVLRQMADEPEADAALRRLLRLSIPHEISHDVLVEMCSLTIARDWMEMTPALVRGLSRSVPDVADDSRVEAKTLKQLHPGRSVTDIALGVLSDPGPREADEPAEVDIPRRVRIEAWNLLARTDPTGEARATWAREPANAGVFGGAIAGFVNELGMLPKTGEELLWAERVWTSPTGRTWVGEAASVAKSLTPAQRDGLELRHIEALRLARGTPWIGMGTGELLSEVARRQGRRQIHVRSIDQIHRQGPNRERVTDWQDRLTWGDLLAIVLIDELARRDVNAAKFVEFAMLDQGDQSTEYGGALMASGDGGVVVRLFPPRPSERAGDERFVASREMLEQTGQALALFHYHVQPKRNRDVAGPSRGDLLTASLLGRTSLVLTMVRPGVLNLDVYFPHGAVVDLGELGASAGE